MRFESRHARILACFGNDSALGSLHADCRTNSNSLKIMSKFGRVDAVRFSFFQSIFSVWNSLPDSIVMQANSDTFYNLCRNHLSKF